MWFAWSGKEVKYIIILACSKAPRARVCTARQVLLMFFYSFTYGFYMAVITHMVRPTTAVMFAGYVSLNVVILLEDQHIP